MPNILAQLVLYSWPLVTWYLFKKMQTGPALVATILLGYLFIPERVGFDPPLLPIVNKHLMPALCALVALMIQERHQAGIKRRAARRNGGPASSETDTVTIPTGPSARKARVPRRRESRIMLFIPVIVGVLILNALMAWMTNQEAIYFSTRVIPGIRPYDIGMLVSAQITAILPLLLGARYLRAPEDQISVLKLLAWCGLFYSVLVIYESRMSPRLNIQLYGFFAHDWIQHLRDGFRPIVFLAHGLRVGIFMAMATLAAAVLARINAGGHRWRWLLLTAWLAGALVMSRNLGATMIAFALLPVILIVPTRLQFLVGAVIAITVLFFPLARGSGLIPAERIVSTISSVNPSRAASLDFRLRNEDALLQRANMKPISGWGGWGRGRIYNAETGRDESITDGVWIIVIGEKGWVGYLGVFGLLCLPAILAAILRKRYALGAAESGLILILCANLIDLIPNSSMTPPIWLIAGALWGRLEQASARSREDRPESGRDRTRTRRPNRPPERLPGGQAPAPQRRVPPYPAKSAPSNT
ncbi:hypothetical protein [Paenirhodobacter populi]|uniref:O-antigen ligase domain-containing protein n=1 Tax=Paenirhodobacter populi TaxID=2306993 RepID=A0A443IP65_9RHOB|nr:hypothetical protein [Sinirhodobacter populi]RWR08138.1 hypothetical protein D2T33_16055 [Sinirhodobacter populi]